ncbi:MAG: PadR family transcriptional regulator [Acidobacteria bacterium]|nr:PadR family transcriptional regulator [Acidobacteriota bacterium]
MTPDRGDVVYGSLGLLILKTLDAIGPMHGYRLARRIEQISGNQLALNQGTLYPALLKLEQMQWVSAKWGQSDTGRRVKIYSLTRAGRKQLTREEAQWQRSTGIIARFFKISEDPA